MAEQEKQQGNTERDDVTDVPSDESAPTGAETASRLKCEMDDLLDEIDTVLETNAEEFVKSYIQKGGQ